MTDVMTSNRERARQSQHCILQAMPATTRAREFTARNRAGFDANGPRLSPRTSPVLVRALFLRHTCQVDLPRDDHPGGAARRSHRAGRRRPGDARQYRRQAGRAQDPPAVQRQHPGRLCRIGGRFVRAVLALRSRSSNSIAATSSARPSSSRKDWRTDRALRRLEAMLIVARHASRCSCCRAPAI